MNDFPTANGIAFEILITIHDGIPTILPFPESWEDGYRNYKANAGTIVKIYLEILRLIPITAE